MAVTDFTISLAIDQAARLLDDAIVGGSVTGERIDSYAVRDENGLRCLVLVYEKHYYRAGNRLTLTVTLENLSVGGPGRTRVHAVGGGGGEGLFRFDWGASDAFASGVEEALGRYRV